MVCRYSRFLMLSDMSINPTIRVWLGGSFDPIHRGHIAMLQHVYHQLTQAAPNVPIVASFLPTAGSPLKTAPTDYVHRRAMLRLVLAQMPSLSLDEYEIHQPPPVYTIDTLTEFAKRYPDDIRLFVLGGDSAVNLKYWRRGNELLNWASLWVIARTDPYEAATNLDRVAQTLQAFFSDGQNLITQRIGDLINTDKNLILIDDFTPPMVASRDIRSWLAALGRTTSPDQWGKLLAQLNTALPPAVLHYILQQSLYGVNFKPPECLF